MAAGGGGGGGGSKASSSAGALESSLDRKFQSVTNTMESIQGLSSWCIENKKHHSTIVYHWMKWLRRSAFPHRLNLFYLANDVIQNCKRKNAIIFRESFAEVLPEAASLVKDPSVSKSVERIFKIWEERNVYPEETIVVLKEALTSTNPKAALKSKIVAEFRSQALIDELLLYKRSEDQIELKEKQLATMRVDVCSTETLKCLKDKTGGKKFSKEFEEASSKLEEFVNGLDKQVKNGPSLTEALENAGVFYEAQYKEVKVVANAYKTFANRVNNLKKKLDQLKSTLPDPEESPVPSPSMDAPSPTGSESPFQGMGGEESRSPAVESEKSATPEPATDNRDVEDMELSDVEDDTSKIIVEDRKEKPVEKPAISTSAPTKLTESVPKAAPCTTASVAVTSTPPPPPPKPMSTSVLPPSPALALPNLANVDLAKISSILSSLTSVMKNTGVSPASRPSPGTPTSPTHLPGNLKAPVPATTTSHNPLANILSKVEITPESILSALSKTQTQAAPALQGLSSLLQSVTGNPVASSEAASQSTSSSPANTSISSMKGRSLPSNTQSFMPKSFSYSPNSSNSEVSSTSVSKIPVGHNPGLPTSSFKPPSNSLGFSAPHSANPAIPSTEPAMGQSSEISKPKLESEPTSPSLEMKIHNFLKGNPGFSGLNLNIPILSSLGASIPAENHPSDFQRGPTSTSMDNIDGTPVRDERSGTPTQDEMMDKPTSSNVDTMSLLSKIISPGSSTPSSTRSPPPGRDDSYSQELSNSVSSYRPFGLGSESPYKQTSDGMERPSSLMDSPQEKFYPDTSFQEDEDYRDFEYSGPPPSAMMNLEKKPAKSILKASKLSDTEYQPIMSSYSHRTQEFGVKSAFPPAMRALLDPSESCDHLSSSPGLYGAYNLRGNESGSDRSPSPSKNDSFFSPDSNHSSLSQSTTAHLGLPQKQYPDSPHSIPHRSLFSPQSTLATPTGRPPTSGVEKVLASTISTTSTIEFKNMLKNASRKPSDDKHFGQAPSKGSTGDGVSLASLVQPSLSSSDQQQQQPEEHYRIETRVSSSCLDLPDSTEEKGAPIETLGYHNASNRRMSGEPIQTVESIRVLGKGNRGHGREPSRVGWFELSPSGSSFDNGPSSASELAPLGGGSGGGLSGFKTAAYKERAPSFQESVGFRSSNFNSTFEHHLPPPPLEHGAPFQREPMGPSSAPPVPSKEHGGLFSRDTPGHLASVDLSNPFTKEAALAHGAPPPPPGDHSGVPFSTPPPPPPPGEHSSSGGSGVPFSNPPPPPPVDHSGVVSFQAPPLAEHSGVPGPVAVFSKEHSSLLQGNLAEHFGVLPGPRDPTQRDLNGPGLSRVREGLSLPTHSREHLGPTHGGGGGGSSNSGPALGAPHRDTISRSGMILRNPRPDFRPRESFLNRDPFHSLKRPRPPFARGPPFFAPKRPFFPPRLFSRSEDRAKIWGPGSVTRAKDSNSSLTVPQEAVTSVAAQNK
ncbi:regulation of nuclear pre-mRNA domain-containing protein 2 isoform X2 [Vombatus ursinus]|uniref:regulation of nuclear pre-mRNA domain-containing protein 2 isoform X2 n=1 Tax=Vombatus ursinus TaxID=29139 RepID=UPI000FFDAA59|nr:regulation of nuclear pre-mRNA domain-containing protein 2 isoform X2 [Vombatus ursinus]XP_027717952.1 regulation of nuclear pre-mRNA domain-containing protein 2 isoform X2 [Vombatus ursinus]